MTGLRESKRAETTQAVVDAAMALVRGRQFEDVTIDELAAAAGISRRTFFRYFPTKEDVLLDSRRVDRAYARDALAPISPEEDDVGRVMRVLAELQRRAFSVFRPEHQLDLHRMTHHEPALAARAWMLLEEMRDVVVDGLVRREASEATLFRARLLVSACIVAVDVGVTTWIEDQMREDLEAILGRAAAQLRRGFAQQSDSR